MFFINRVHAIHILVRTEEEAKTILEELGKGTSFAQLAQEKSICPSGKKGGDLGWFGRGKMVKPFERAAFSMKKGEVSQPVKSDFGWHIIKVVETQ